MTCACHTFTTSTFCYNHLLCMKCLPLINFKLMKSCLVFKIQPKQLSIFVPARSTHCLYPLSFLIVLYVLSCITYSSHNMKLVGRLAQHFVGSTSEGLQHINIGKSIIKEFRKITLFLGKINL